MAGTVAPFWLIGGQLCLPDGITADRALLVAGDRVAAIATAPTPGDVAIDLHGALVAPGFIDTHIHGGLHADVMDADVGGLATIGHHLVAHGVTSWLPTTVACPAAQLDAILQAIATAMAEPPEGARVLGAHLESNFLAARYKGAQPAEHLRAPDDATLRAVINRHQGTVKVVTLAPELPGALDLVREIVALGIQVSIGHSDAAYDQVMAAVSAGASRVTHWCNAMRPYHHREPGVAGTALVLDDVVVELIADGVHVHPVGVQIAYRCKGADRLMLVSDALRGTGLPPGTYELGGQVTQLDGRVARLADGTIAGSSVTLEVAVATAIAAGVPPERALAMASATPAASLGLTDRGRLAPGLLADLVVLDSTWQCQATLLGGAWAHGDPTRLIPAAI